MDFEAKLLQKVNQEFTCSPPENTSITLVFTHGGRMHTTFKRPGLKTQCATK